MNITGVTSGAEDVEVEYEFSNTFNILNLKNIISQTIQ
jgi:hypothetical protein